MAGPVNPEAWPQVELAEICELPRTQIRPAEFSSYRYYVGLEHIDGGTGKVIEYQDVGQARLKSSKFHFDDSCILYGKLRPYLNKVALPDVSGVCSTDILPLRPKPGLASREYLYYVMRTPFFVRTATSKSAGANLPRIAPETLLDIRVPLPPIHAQRKIVEILTAVDVLRSKRQQANQLANKIVPSVFLKMFGNPTTNPMSWPISAIGDIVQVTQYGISRRLDDNTGHAPVIRMNNITADGRLDLGELRYAEIDQETVGKYQLERGDLLFNRTNSRELVGKTGLFDEEGQFTFASYLIRLKVNNRVATPEYVWGFLNSTFGKETLLKRARGAVGQANINARELRLIAIPLPPIELQVRFSDFVHRAKRLYRQQMESTREITQLFHSLVHKVFRGEPVT